MKLLRFGDLMLFIEHGSYFELYHGDELISGYRFERVGVIVNTLFSKFADVPVTKIDSTDNVLKIFLDLNFKKHPNFYH